MLDKTILRNINLQLLADGTGVPGAEDADEAGEDGPANEAGMEDSSQSTGVDTSKADRIAKARAERAARAAVTSYFKQQGMTTEEAQEAFNAYKKAKAEQEEEDRNNLQALQQKLEGYEAKESEAIKNANRRLVRAEAMVQATGLNVNPDRIDYLIRLADLTQIEVDEHGNADGAAIRVALEEVLTDIPELKNKSADEDTRPGFKVGSPGQQAPDVVADQVSAILATQNKNNNEVKNKICTITQNNSEAS